jgi:hypothetical protein
MGARLYSGLISGSPRKIRTHLARVKAEPPYPEYGEHNLVTALSGMEERDSQKT